MSDTLKEIVQWFEIAKPGPTGTDFNIQVRCHVEEFIEMLEALGVSSYPTSRLEYLQKTYAYHNTKGKLSKNDLLDSLCDQIVTAMGVGYMMGFDMQGALAEVSRSNMSKFEDGKAVFFENGKIAKGKDYSEPDLARFLGD